MVAVQVGQEQGPESSCAGCNRGGAHEHPTPAIEEKVSNRSTDQRGRSGSIRVRNRASTAQNDYLQAPPRIERKSAPPQPRRRPTASSWCHRPGHEYLQLTPPNEMPPFQGAAASGILPAEQLVEANRKTFAATSLRLSRTAFWTSPRRRRSRTMTPCRTPKLEPRQQVGGSRASSASPHG
jgi:hypothetical protein